MAKFDSKEFNPQAFGAYVNRIPNTKKTELAKSGAVGANAQARAALATQTGSLYARIPYFGRIDGSTSQNNDGATNIQSSNTSTFSQGYVTASRMDAWTERSFSKSITAGVDFMDNVAAQISEYKLQVRQALLLAILQGVFSMDGTANTVAGRAAAAFLAAHVYNVAGIGDGCVGAATLNTAMQRACGDNKDIFKLVLMHSTVATNLENLRLIKYLTYTDKDGITRDLGLGTWNGRTVLIDDGMPTVDVDAVYELTGDTDIDTKKTYYTRSGSGTDASPYTYTAVASPAKANIGTYYEITDEAHVEYKTFALGLNAINLDDIGDDKPYEMVREAIINGGQDTLIVRDRYIVGVEGLDFILPAACTASATNAMLADGSNWAIINDGTTAIDHKAIPIVCIISRG